MKLAEWVLRTIHKLTLCVPLLATVTSETYGQTCPVQLGFNLTHIHVSEERANACRTPGHLPLVARSGNIILNFRDPNTQDRVASALGTMLWQGASIVRLMLWFRVGQDAPSSDTLGTVATTSGKAPDEVLEGIRGIISELRARGVRAIVLAFSPLGAADPNCRHREFGDCFRPETLPIAQAFERQIIEVASAAAGPVSINFDLGNELCFDPDSGAAAGRNAKLFLNAMMASQIGSPTNSKPLVSCSANGPLQMQRRLAAVIDMFQKNKMKPALVDAHIYASSAEKATQELLAAEKVAEDVGVPLVIGETSIDHPNLFDTIKALKAEGRLSSLAAVLVWPTRTGSGCGIGVAPPYPLAQLMDKLCPSRLDPGGKNGGDAVTPRQ